MTKIIIPENINIETKSANQLFSFCNFILSTMYQSQYFTTYNTLLELDQFITLLQDKQPGDEVQIPENLFKILKDLLVAQKFDSPQKGLLVLPWMKYIINLSE